MAYGITVTNNGDTKAYDISIAGTFGSIPATSGASLSYVSASDNLDPTARSAAGVAFVNIRDLAPGESYTLHLTMKLSDTKWSVGDTVTGHFTSTSLDLPADVPGANTQTNVADKDVTVIPIAIVSKTANQSTGVEQATGTQDRTYSYTIDIQNNYTDPTANVVITDTLDDGIQYQGMLSGATPNTVTRSNTTGKTVLTWNLGTASAGQETVLKYKAGIRYDYYGTANGGLNTSDTASVPTTLTAPIPNKKSLDNKADLTGTYTDPRTSQVTPVSTSASDAVSAAYFTGSKGQTVHSGGGPGSEVDYSLTYCTSQYYAVAATASVLVTDTLPDGLTYKPGSSVPAPLSVTHHGDGTTDIVWVRPPIAASSSAGIAFTAIVDDTYEAPALVGQPVRSGDGFTNRVTFDTIWDDLVNAGRPNNRTVSTASSASASFTEPLPSVLKQVWDPKASAWSKAATVTVGDVMHYRVCFNTNGNRSPLLTTVPMGSIDLADWLPMGTSLVPGSIVTTFSPGAFSPVGGKVPNPSVPATLSAGGITGEGWWLGDVAQAGWWQAEFDVIVTSDPAVTGGVRTNNMWKMTGTNSYGKNYSDRDLVDLAYGEPLLTVTKVPQSPSAAPGVGMPYAVTLDNAAGTSPARGLKLVDQLPAGMRTAVPTLDSVASYDPSTGTTSTVAASRFTTAYDAVLGSWTVVPKPGEGISVPTGGRLVFSLTATPDTTAGAGTVLPNTATVNYATQDDTATARSYAPVTANASVTLPGVLTTNKAGSPANLTIGDTATYTVTADVPAGQIAYWPALVDNLPIGGASYVPGSATLANVSGTPVSGAAFNSGSTPAIASPTNTSTRLTWQLANPIDNRGQAADYVFSLTFRVRVTGLDHGGAKEFWPMPANSSVAFTDAARTDWNTTPVASPGSPDKSTANATASTTVKQPWLTVTKAVTNGASFGGNSPVNFTVTATNAGAWQAEHLSFADYLPVGMRNTTPTIAAVRIGGVTQAPASYTVQPYDPATGLLSVAFPDGTKVSAGATLGVDVVATTDVSPLSGSTLVNTASVGFDTQPDGSGRSYPATSTAGANTGSVNVLIASPTSVKSIVSSTTAGIGDVVTYRIRTTVPARTLAKNVSLVDTVQNTGMAFLAGSALLSDVSGSPSVPAALNPVTQVTTAGLVTTFNVDSLTANRIIDNSLSATPYVFDVTYSMSVTGLNGATWVWFAKGATATSNNKVALNWTANTGAKSTTGGNIPLTVKWPNLTVTKTSDVATAVAGQTVNYTVTVKNDGTFPAYAAASGPSMTDTLPAGIDPATVSLVSVQRSWPATNTLVAGTDYTSAVVGSQLQVTYTQPGDTNTVVPVGGILTFKYSGVLKPDVGAGAQLTNTAAAFWSSEPTAAPYARNYTGTNANQPAGWKASVTVGVPNTALLKTFSGSGATTYTIGQEVPYTVVAAIPLNTTAYNAVMTDFIPKGLTVTTATVSPSGLGTLVIGPKSGTDGRTPITWTAGNVQNPSTAILTLNATATVDTTYFPSGGNVAAGQSIVNTAAIAWKDQASGGTTVTTTSNAVAATVVEPQLTVTKSLATPITAGKAWAGQTVTYTVDVTNGTVNASPAYGLVLHDLLPANLFRPSDGSPHLVSVTLNGVPLSSPSDYLADLSANPVSLDLATPLLGAAIPVGGTLRLTYTATLPPAPATTDGATWSNTATANSWSSLRGGGRTYGPAAKTVTLTTQAPRLTVVKTVLGDSYLQWGRVATYQAVVHNAGTAPANAFAMVDTLSSLFMSEPIPGTPQATWPTGSASPGTVLNPLDNTVTWGTIPATLQPGQDLTLTWSQTVLNTAPLGSQDDTVAVSAQDPAGGPIVAAPAHVAITVTDPRVQAVKVLHAGQNPYVPLGATVTYDLSVANTGNTTMVTVPMTDDFDSSRLDFVSASVAPDSVLPTGHLTWNNRAGAGVAPGSRTATVTVTLRTKAVGYSVTDTATALPATDSHASKAATSTATENSLTVTNPHVRLTKALQGPALVPVGSVVSYRLTFLNDGDTTLTALPLADTFDTGHLAYASSTVVPGSTLPVGHLGWGNVLSSPLAPGDSVSLDVSFSTLATGTAVSNAASSTAGTDEHGGTVPTTTATDSTLAIGKPLLTVAKASSITTVQAGDTVTYTVSVRNAGNTPAYDLGLSDAIPADLFAADSSPVLAGVTLDGIAVPSGFAFGNASNPVSFTAADALAIPAGSTLVATYRVTVPAGIAGGRTETNTVTVPSYRSLPGGGVAYVGPSASTAVHTLAPTLSITKELTSSPWLQSNGTASYRVTVRNDGTAAATDFDLVDALSSGYLSVPLFAGIQATWPGGAEILTASLDTATHRVSFSTTHATLQPGQSLVLTWSQTVAFDAPTGPQNDSVTVTGHDAAGGPVTTGPATASFTVTDPHVAVAKVLHPGQSPYVPLGQTVYYDIAVTNTGDTTLTHVPLTDAYDASRLQFISGSADDWSVPGTLTWNELAGAGLAPGSRTATITIGFRAIATGTDVPDTATVAGARDVHGDTAATATAAEDSVTLSNPHVRVTKTLLGTSLVPLGSEVTYRLDLANDGDTVLASLPLADGFDGGALSFVSASSVPDTATPVLLEWADALGGTPLAAGDTRSLTVTFLARSVGDGILNAVSVSGGRDANGSGVPSASDTNADLSVGVPDLSITKSVDATSAEAGQPVHFTVEVTNSGNTPAYGVKLLDLFPSDMPDPVFTGAAIDGSPLVPGEYAVDTTADPTTFSTDIAGGAAIPPGGKLVLSYTATLAGGTANGVTETNWARLDSCRTLPLGGVVLWNGTTATASLVSLAPVLAMEKTVTGRNVIQPGDETSYRMTVTNIGDATARTIAFGDWLSSPQMSPVGLATLTMPDGHTVLLTPMTASFTFDIWYSTEPLSPGETATLDWTMAATPSTGSSTQSDQGLAAGFDGGGSEVNSNFSNASVLVTIPHLTVTKTLVGPALVPVAADAAYDITFTNDGTTDIPSIPATDAYDAVHLAPTGQVPAADASAGGTLSWNDVTGGQGLASGSSVTVRASFSTLVTGAAIADTVTVAGLADVDGSPVPSSEATNGELTVGRPELTITKAASVATAVAGQVVTYTVGITNVGSTPAYHVRLNDTFDPALPPVLDAVTLDGVPAAHSTGIFGDVLYVGLDATPIPAGSTVTVAYHATVPSGLPDRTALPNDAYVTSYTSLPGGGVTYDGPSADATVTALAPFLEAKKTVEGGTHPVAGDTVHYRLDVTNTGHAPASTLTVRDVLSDGDMNPVAAGTVTWPDGSQTTMGGSGVLGLWTMGPVPGALLPGQTAVVRWDMRVAADATPGTKTDTATAISQDSADIDVRSMPSSASVLVTRPSVSVHKVLLAPANGHAPLGTTVTYGITVTNTGDTTLTAVPLADSYDSSRIAFASAGLHPDTVVLGDLGWTDILPAGGTLAPGATTATLTVSFTATGTGTAVDTATVSGATDVWGHVPADAGDRNAELTVTRPHVAVTKDLSAGQDSYVARGHTVSYDITVTNDGDTPLATLPLTDTYDASRLVPVSAVPATDTAVAGTLAWADLLSSGPALVPGGSRSVTVTFRTIASGSLADTATVTGAIDTWGGTAPEASARNAVAAGTNPGVSLSKTLAPGQSPLIAVGSTVTYDFRVTNSGDTTLATVPLTDAYLDPQMAFVSATPSGAVPSPGLLAWADITSGAGLAPGQTTTATATFRVLQASAALDDTATVNGLDVFGTTVPPQGSSNDVAGSYAAGDLTLVKTSDPVSGSVVASGSLIHYTLTYLNSSPTTVTAGVVSDTLVPALVYVPGSIALNGSPVADAAGWDAASSTLSVVLPPVGPGELGTVTFTARVAPWDLSRRGILNSAAWSDGGSVIATAEPTVHNVDPLDVVKTVRDVSGKGKVRTGDVLEWTIQVVNHGVVPATGVRVTDDVPKGTTYVKGSIKGPGASAAKNPHLSWAVGTIAVDGTITVSFRSKVGGVKSGTRISNQAVAYADQSRPKRSSTAASTVDDPTTVVVRTSGDELWTLWLVLLLLALALGLALPRPKAVLGRRLLRGSAVLLVLAALLAGGSEVAAANGFDVPTPSGVLASLMAPAAVPVEVAPASVSPAAVQNRVSIPRIGLSVRLVEGKDMSVLARGLWHQPPSVSPGERGATVIAGHRIAGEFINLHLVRKGDRVTVTYGGKSYAYKVSSVQDVASTSPTASFRVGSVEKLILYTCTPRWQGNRRTIVTCLPVR